MGELKSLVEFVQKTKFKSLQMLDLVLEPNTQLRHLYEQLSLGEAEAEDDILSATRDVIDESQLPSLKSKLKDRLLDIVFLLDFKESDYRDRQRAFLMCSKKWAACMILLHKNMRQVGIAKLEQLLRHTLSFEFTELSLETLRVLRLHYGTVEGDFKKYRYYEERLLEQERIWLAERQAESLYIELAAQYVNAKAGKDAAFRKSIEYYKRIEPNLEQFKSFKVHLYGRLIETLIFECQNDYAGMARVCEEAIQFYKNKDYKSDLSLQVFYYNLVNCYLHLRQFEKGQNSIYLLEQLVNPGSINWFKIQELYFFMAMHTKNYNEAWTILCRVQNAGNYNALPVPMTELWKIFEAYANYLILIGILKPESQPEQQKDFRVNRFLNEMEIFSKDKCGMNISLLILQFLFALARGQFNSCEKQIEALAKYRLRYLRDKDTLRSNRFIKLLLKIPQYDYKVPEIRKKTEKTEQALRAIPWEEVNQSREIEIIPYEDLWEMALDSLA